MASAAKEYLEKLVTTGTMVKKLETRFLGMTPDDQTLLLVARGLAIARGLSMAVDDTQFILGTELFRNEVVRILVGSGWLDLTAYRCIDPIENDPSGPRTGSRGSTELSGLYEAGRPV